MIRSIILGIAIFAASIGAIYLMGAFYSLDLNFAHWTADTRMGCVVGFAFLLLVVIPVCIMTAIMPPSPVPTLPPRPPSR